MNAKVTNAAVQGSADAVEESPFQAVDAAATGFDAIPEFAELADRSRTRAEPQHEPLHEPQREPLHELQYQPQHDSQPEPQGEPQGEAQGETRDEPRGGRPTGRDAPRYEALALGAMAGASAPAVWLSHARPTAWVAIAMLTMVAVSALHPRLSAGTFGRGCTALTAAALLAVSAPQLSTVAALWSVIAVGVLTTRLPGDTGWLLTAAGGGMLAMLETVLSLMAEPLGMSTGPSGVLLVGAAGTIGAGTVGSAVAHRLALGDTGWAVDPGLDTGLDPVPDPDAGRWFGVGRFWSRSAAPAPIAPAPVSSGPSTDPLTGMATRGVLLRGINRALARVDVIGGQVALFALDVDRLDVVTHQHGARRADELLRHLARRLRAAMPAEDVVARVGPATFAVLVEGVGPDGCEPLVHRMAALLEEEMLIGGVLMSVTCSVGTAIADADLHSPERLLRAASTAMHTAQTAGHGRWVHHDPAVAAHDASRESIERDLRAAVTAGDVQVTVQGVVDLAADPSSDRIGGVEVHARWTRPDGAGVPGQHVVAVAEELGLGARLGEVVLDRALDLLVRWGATDEPGAADFPDGAAGPGSPGTPVGPRYVAVNLSRSQLEDAGFAQHVADRLAALGIAPSRLTVEVSAVTFVDTDQARRTLGMLRSLGVGVAVDDFGRGPLGLLTLRQLPVDTVKIDRQVTMELGRDDTLAATVLSLCRATGRRCIAEGVESTAQLEAARRLGLDGAQGFLLGRPMPPAATPPRHVG